MIFRITIIQLLLLIAVCVNGQSNWDTLFLRNGQVVFGTLKSISLGHVEFDAEDLSVENIKMSKIKTMSASRKIYHIQTINHKDIFSIIRPSQKVGYVVIGDSSHGIVITPLNYIASLTYFSAKKNLLEGDISTGYSFTKSSSIGRFNLDGSLRYLMRKGEFDLSASAIATQDTSKWSRDRESVNLNGTLFFNTRWRAVTLLSYQRNLELGLARRFQEGGGIAYTFISKRRLRGNVFTGIVINQERSIGGEQKLFSTEVPVLINFNFFKFRKPDIAIKTTQNLYFSLSEQGRIRHDGEIKIEWKIIRDFTVNLKFYDNYDSKSNASQSSNFDYGTVFGLGYKFD